LKQALYSTVAEAKGMETLFKQLRAPKLTLLRPSVIGGVW
jgi:hypothetical protein